MSPDNSPTIKSDNISKLELLMLQLIMIAPCFFMRLSLDNDAYWIIQSGRYVIENGIPTIEPLTLHEGLNFVMQQWLTAVTFASIYDTMGTIGLLMFIMCLFIAIVLLLHRLCLMISDNNFFISYVVTIVDVVVLFIFMTTRPYPISMLLFLIEIFILEKHVRTGNRWILAGIPVLSLLLINFHSAMWPFMFVLLIPYLIDSFKFRLLFVHGEGFPRRNLLIAIFVAALAGFINPYGLKAMTYLFRSYGHESISRFVSEMKSPNFQTGTGLYVFAIFLAVVLVLILAKSPKLKLRYALLMLGTGFMALSSLRNLSLFAICGIPFLAYTLRFAMPKVKKTKGLSLKTQRVLLIIFLITVVGTFGIRLNDSKSYVDPELPIAAVAFIQQEYQGEKIRLFSDYNWGGYAEFKGLKPFIDARAEVFLKVNNGKENILDDLISLYTGEVYYTDFIAKYRLNVFLILKGDLLDVYLSRDDNFRAVYQDREFIIYEKK